MGEPWEMYDAEQMAELTGTNYYQSGLYTPGTVMLQPAGYVRGLADGLHDSVTIHENTPALSLDRKGADWTVKTPQGSVTTGAVILANNGHLESFGFAKRRLMHVFLFATMTGDLSDEDLGKLGGQPRWGITPSDPMGTTVRRIDSGQGGNRIVTRTCAHFQPSMQISHRQLDRAKRVMRQKFNARFPALAGTVMQYAWAGHLCLSRNGVSVVGRLDDGIFAACCQNGLGTARGTLTGMAAAEIASGTTSALTRHFSNAAPPTRLPPPPLSTVGANAILRWKEHQARQE
jgi:glycine/D-amino acid oxidase-like deaminating enzyme